MTDEIRPKLRQGRVSRGQQQGQPMLVLSDPSGLSDCSVVLPASLAPVLELCDGTRYISTLRAVLELRAGLRVGPGYLEKLFAALDKALLMDGGWFVWGCGGGVVEYRC